MLALPAGSWAAAWKRAHRVIAVLSSGDSSGRVALAAMIVVLVVGVRRLPQPWHGLVDLGVAGGLVWVVGLLLVVLMRRK